MLYRDRFFPHISHSLGMVFGLLNIPASEVRVQTDPRLETMDWLVDGVIGSTG